MTEHKPGWYEHEGERRFWDGQQWTASASVPQIPSHDAPPAPPTPSAPSTPATPPPPPGQMAPPSQVVPYPQQGGYGQQAPPFAPGTAAPPRKEPALSLLVSFFVPGVGSMMNGDTGVGVAILCTYLGSLLFIFCLGWILIGFIGLPVMVGAWIWGMVDAYQGAVRHNQRMGYPG